MAWCFLHPCSMMLSGFQKCFSDWYSERMEYSLVWSSLLRCCFKESLDLWMLRAPSSLINIFLLWYTKAMELSLLYHSSCFLIFVSTSSSYFGYAFRSEILVKLPKLHSFESPTESDLETGKQMFYQKNNLQYAATDAMVSWKLYQVNIHESSFTYIILFPCYHVYHCCWWGYWHQFLLVKQVLKSLPDAKDAPLTIQVRKLNQHNCMYTTVQMITSC